MSVSLFYYLTLGTASQGLLLALNTGQNFTRLSWLESKKICLHESAPTGCFADAICLGR